MFISNVYLFWHEEDRSRNVVVCFAACFFHFRRSSRIPLGGWFFFRISHTIAAGVRTNCRGEGDRSLPAALTVVPSSFRWLIWRFSNNFMYPGSFFLVTTVSGMGSSYAAGGMLWCVFLRAAVSRVLRLLFLSYHECFACGNWPCSPKTDIITRRDCDSKVLTYQVASLF